MALTATLYSFDIELAHIDRGVYESLSFRIAQHPSETEDFLLARVLAYCLEYTDGIQFSPGGLSDANEPPIAVRSPTGQLRAWIDVGLPDAARLHKAAKAAPRVVVYTHKDPTRLVRELTGERIHRAEALELYSIDREFLAQWVARLTRRVRCNLTVSDGQILLTVGDDALSAPLEALTLPG